MQNRGTRRTLAVGLVALAVLAGALGSMGTSPEALGRAGATAPGTADDGPPPQGDDLTPGELQELAAEFDDMPYAGGQVPPRVSKWLSGDVVMFLQFDTAAPEDATALNFIGLGLRSRYCPETQPDPSWPHFHRWVAPTYGMGHALIPSAEGFWLSWMSLQEEDPGIAYDFSPTPPIVPCGPLQDLPDLMPTGDAPPSAELAELAALFDDAPFAGGQAAPYAARWVNEEVFVWLEIEGAALRSAGMGIRGKFCEADQPTSDFTHFHRWHATEWAQGAGGAPGAWGYWLARYGTDTGGSAPIGIDRAFEPTPPPECAA